MYSVDLSEEQIELMKKHLNLVIEANKITNLTRIDSIDQGMLLHVEDSLSALKEFRKAPEGKYADLGTGGGFPGVCLSIATGRDTTLVDARRKKTEIIDSIIQELGMEDQIRTYTGRIEEMAAGHRNEFSVVTARALAKLSVLMEFASPIIRKEGHLICYKGQPDKEELDHALGLQKKLGFKFISKRDLVLSDGETHRCIIVFQKVSEPIIKLPRQNGFAQKKPL